MGRRERLHFDGAVYHVIDHGVIGQNIFIDDADYRLFIDLMDRLFAEAGIQRIAYCLMPNHFHLLVRVGSVPLKDVMRRLLTSYATRFNQRHNRWGHLFVDRYKARICLDDRYLANLIRYVHMNPVHHGFTDDPATWRWSSIHEFRARGQSGLAASEGEFAAITDEFEARSDPWAGIEADVPESGCLLRQADVSRTPLIDVGAQAAEAAGVSVEELRSTSRRRTVCAARASFTLGALKKGYRPLEIAEFLGVTASYVSKIVKYGK